MLVLILAWQNPHVETPLWRAFCTVKSRTQTITF